MRVLIFLIICLLLSGCLDLSTTEDVNKSMITEMLEDIRISFSLADLNNIMSYYHDDYFHNGDLYGDEAVNWESRLVEYVEMDVEDIETDINGIYAVVSFTLTFRSIEGSESWSEPSEEHGDISYLIFSNDEWKIFGNQIDPDYLP